jgi:hypothetical protein
MKQFNELVESYFSQLSEEKMPKMFSPSGKVEYSFNDVKAGTLSDDERRIYDAVDKGSSYTGADLLDYLKDEIQFDPREDLNVSKIKRVLNNLLDKEVLNAVLASRGEGEEIEALDTMDDEDLEFRSSQDVEDYIDPSFKKSPRFFENLQEAKKSYSAKKAREGKDIGKKGKMFGKIAKSAAKKYGSKEAGAKVAGAILKKLRAK